ncbi:ANTAR domain-containing protein [Intrasporangium sp. YIM S08009]|uniref:ANTAR domain-containing protein n=1 Tax=Intrasporangium zincisolvens TaxID=3080018 RepID=UPI002B052F52|nr:ANTAR domain-containing protein [Intrasporangium sp. YIM S08009]
MGTETSGFEDLTRRFDEMSAQLALARADIETLLESSGRAHRRLDAGEDEAGRSRGQAAEDRERIKALEDRAAIDRELLVEIRNEGLLLEGENRSLHEALQTARAIGAAVGIVMALRQVKEVEAFGVLRVASQAQNRKLRVIAEEIVIAGDLTSLPEH